MIIAVSKASIDRFQMGSLCSLACLELLRFVWVIHREKILSLAFTVPVHSDEVINVLWPW